MEQSWTPGRKVMAIAAGVLILGAFLPWATVNAGFISASKTGIEGDGVVTAGIGAVVLLVVALKAATAQARWVLGFIGGLLAGLMAAYDVHDVQSAGSSAVLVQVGIGLWLSGAAAVAVMVGAAMQRAEVAEAKVAGERGLG